MKSFASLALAVMLALAAFAPQNVRAQSYPAKPVRLVVPYAPGGATDIISRAAAIVFASFANVLVLHPGVKAD